MIGPMRYFSDYKIADCLYADPQYWDRDTQDGIRQWSAQRIGSIAFPSSKGFARQVTVYDIPGFADGYPACCVESVRAPVLWADLSATVEIQADLTPGVPNFWHHGQTGRMSLWSTGTPIDNTPGGVRGRDR